MCCGKLCVCKYGWNICVIFGLLDFCGYFFVGLVSLGFCVFVCDIVCVFVVVFCLLLFCYCVWKVLWLVGSV